MVPLVPPKLILVKLTPPADLDQPARTAWLNAKPDRVTVTVDGNLLGASSGVAYCVFGGSSTG